MQSTRNKISTKLYATSVLSQEESSTKTLQIVTQSPNIHHEVCERRQNVLASENHLAARDLFEKLFQKKLVRAPRKRKNVCLKGLSFFLLL